MTELSAIFSSKLSAMLGGFFGGAAILTFIKPKSVGEAFTRGSVSTGSAIIFAHPVEGFLKINSDWDTQLMVGFCIGFIAYSILGMVANFLKKNQNKDIVETIREVRRP